MKFKTPLWKHQAYALEISKQTPNLALFMECGTGKTGAAINIIRDRMNQRQHNVPVLVLAPLATLTNWKREFALHSYIDPARICVLDKSNSRKRDFKKHIERFPDGIVIVNYDAFRTSAFYEMILDWKPEILVCDESHMLKSHSSKRSKAVFQIARNCTNRFILTGTPILNNAMDIFQQFKILDLGETFGDNFFVFRSQWFYDKNAAWSGSPKHFKDWALRPESEGELHKLMDKKSIRVLKKDCLDLPPLIKLRHNVELSKDQRTAYDEMQRHLITFVNDELTAGIKRPVVAKLALTKALRLTQIVTGFVKTEEGQEVSFDKVPRLQELETLLEELTIDNSVIVWCAFKNNYKAVAKVCTKLGISHVFLTGEQNVRQKQDSIDEFNSGAARVIIANRQAGGIGINLTQAAYSIVFSRDFSLGAELQSEARNYRGGSEIHDKIVKIDLCTPGTIDEMVLEALAKKQKISDDIIDYVRRM